MTKKTIEWIEVVEPPVYCDALRGNKSSIRCEKPPEHEGYHAGRGNRGQWYFWHQSVPEGEI